MAVYKPTRPIGETARNMVALADETKETVTAEFQGITLTAKPGDDPASIVKYYFAELQKEKEKAEVGNLRRWIEEHCAKTGERLIAFVAGEPFEEGDILVPKDKWGVLLGPESLSLLDKDFNCGFTSVCQAQPVVAWTKESVLVLSEYDGAVGMTAIPRNPTAFMPEILGGE